MKPKRWKRIGVKAGPANLLDDRWKVVRGADSWTVLDLAMRGRSFGSYRTMREAREQAERRAEMWRRAYPSERP